MYNIKIVVLIIAVNVVRAENVTPPGIPIAKSAPNEDIPDGNEDKTANAEQDSYADENEERSASLGQSDEYNSRSVMESEESPDKEQTRRFAGENLDDSPSDADRKADDQADGEAYEEEDKMATPDSKQNVRSTNLRDEEAGLNIDPTKRKMMTHHVMLDTKGRSAAEDANQEVLKTVLSDLRSVEDPQLLGNPRPCFYPGSKYCALRNPLPILYQRNGHVISRYPTVTRPGMFYSPNIYTVHHPPVFYNRPSSAERISIPINPTIKRSSENIGDPKTELPFLSTNSYPYQTPLTALQEEPNKIDILKKLIEATNSALTPNDHPIQYIEQPNMFPGNNPFASTRYRRSLELNINSLRAM